MDSRGGWFTRVYKAMIFVDVETTGLSPERHSIVSIGAVEFPKVGRFFYGECAPFLGAEIDDRALEVNGFIRDALVANPTTLEQVIEQFLEWSWGCSERTLAGHNVGSFDLQFLEYSARRLGVILNDQNKWPFGHRVVDLHSICYSHFLRLGLTPPSKYKRSDLSLDKILEFVGLPAESRPHHALTGAQLEAEAYGRLVFGRSWLEQFKDLPVPNYLKLSTNTSINFVAS